MEEEWMRFRMKLVNNKLYIDAKDKHYRQCFNIFKSVATLFHPSPFSQEVMFNVSHLSSHGHIPNNKNATNILINK